MASSPVLPSDLAKALGDLVEEVGGLGECSSPLQNACLRAERILARYDHQQAIERARVESRQSVELDIVAKVKTVIGAYHGCDEAPYDCHSLPDAIYTLQAALDAYDAKQAAELKTGGQS